MSAEVPPRAGATASPRGAINEILPFEDMKAIREPSGEYCGVLFMPGRSTMVRELPPSTDAA
jgi:hypothetical protein